MGNCCNNESKSQTQHEERIKRENEREEAKRQLEEGLKNMANGGHQMLSSFTAPYNFQPAPGKNYFKFGWPPTGSVLVTSFGVRVVAQGQNVEFVEGLANYATFQCTWKPYTEKGQSQSSASTFQITLDQYHSVDANTGEQTPVNTSPKLFLVDAQTGKFIRVLNVDELVDEAVSLAVMHDKTTAQKDELRRLLMQQREVMIKGVIDDIALMWRCWVEIWTHEEVEAGPFETIWNTKCTRRKKVVKSEPVENKKILDKFYDDLFASMNQSNSLILRPQVVLDKAVQLQVYNSLFTNEGGIRCHQTSYRKFTESTISIQNLTSSRAEFEGKRWVFGWSDIPELSSRAYMVSLFSEYASVGGAFHDRLTEKYSHSQLGGDDRVDILSMLISHPFITEPNDSVVIADQTKQKIASMIQMANGAHSMFSGLSPPIQYGPKDDLTEYYTFQWPKEGLVKVCALGFTIKVVDAEVAFTQGLGTFIMFDVRWQRCADCAKYGVPAGSVEIFLESNILINAQSGTEEPLLEPSKHLIISSTGDLLQIVNMSELVDYAIETAIIQRGVNITPEEKTQYRTMLIQTQQDTLTKAVQCDLSFIWASWVQLWTNQRKTGQQMTNSAVCAFFVGEEISNFGLTTVELSSKHSSSPSENKKTVANLIHSVISNSSTGNDVSTGSLESKLRMEKEIEVETAIQEESYTTLFEKDTVRPFVASYQKVTQTEIALHVAPASSSSSSSSQPSSPMSPVLHQISQTEFKNSRHVFIWSDVPQLSTKDYIQSVYQNYLDSANQAYAELKAEKERK